MSPRYGDENGVRCQGMLCANDNDNRPIRLTQCCTQFKSPGVKILCVLYLNYNVTFTFMEIPEAKRFIHKGFELGTNVYLAE